MASKYGPIFSFAKNQQQQAPAGEENYGMPSNWKPIDAPPIDPSRPTGAPPASIGVDPYASGPLPSNFGYQPALVKTTYPGTAAPIGLMPIQSIAAANAKTIGIATQIVKEIASVPGPPGPAGANGITSIPYISYVENFEFFKDTALNGTKAPAGDLDWTLTGQFGVSTNIETGSFPHLGWVGWDNSGVADRCGVLVPYGTGLSAQQTAWPLFETPGWKMVFIFQFLAPEQVQNAPSFLQKSVYIGLNGLNDYPVGATTLGRPQMFVGVRYDTDPTSPAISDTTFHFEVVENTPTSSYSRNNTQGTVIDTGITPTDQVWYTLEILCTIAGQAVLSLSGSDGSSSGAQTFTIPQFTLSGTVNVGRYNAGRGFISIAAASQLSPWASGSILNISNLTGAVAGMNGVRTCYAYNTSLNFFMPSGSSIGLTSSAYTVTGYPAWMPCFRMGNDSQSSPSGNLSIWFDRWEFYWDPTIIV